MGPGKAIANYQVWSPDVGAMECPLPAIVLAQAKLKPLHTYVYNVMRNTVTSHNMKCKTHGIVCDMARE